MRTHQSQFWDETFKELIVGFRIQTIGVTSNTDALNKAIVNEAADIADYALQVREERTKAREKAEEDAERAKRDAACAAEKARYDAMPESERNKYRLDIECEDSPTTPATDGQK